MRAAEIDTLFTANVDQIVKADKLIKDTGKRVEGNPIKLDANGKPALESMDRVEQAAKKLVSKDTLLTVDANIERGEKSLDRVQKRLDYLRSVETTMDVKADIARAEASLSKVSRNLDGLKAARATMEVDADTSEAESALEGVKDVAGDAGEDSGKEFGDSIIAALVSIPIAGAVVGIAAAAAKGLVSAFNEGLQVEVGYDRLQALTGIDEAAALRLGRAAGEAYASNFGTSIESNMDTTRLALQFQILDPAATTRDAQLVVQGLAGIADVLGEEVQPVARTTAALLSSGLAKNATEAFDLIATGARNGVDRSEDLLDTLTEYPALFQRLGLSGPEALGLISQGLDAGARNSDLAADALKEFQIRATDASETSAVGFRTLGLNAEEMTAKIAAGGESAREGLAQVLDGLRAIEDPVARNAAAVALFGTQAEDLGAALFAMDLSTAVDQLDGVTGSAQRMFDTLAGNDASKIEQAQRNIEVAADGIKGALASAFSEPLGELADFVSQNRGPVLRFLLDMANGALDFGDSVVESVASGTESLGDFVGSLSQVVYSLSALPRALGDTETANAIVDMANGMIDFANTSDETADGIRENLGGAIDTARDKLNEFGEPQVALGYLNDAALRTADAVSQVGAAAEGGAALLSGFEVSADGSVRATGELREQLDKSSDALLKEYDAAIAAGESQANLTDRYNTTRGALMGQLTAMGLTQEQAQALIDTVLQTPEEASTTFTSNADEERGKVENLTNRVVTMPDGDTTLRAYTDEAMARLQSLKDRLASIPEYRRITLETFSYGTRNVSPQAQGAVVEFMANGGLPGLTPMAPLAQMVPSNTWRVVGDRGDVPEAYIPLDGSPRSIALLMEAFRRMPNMEGMAAGGVSGSVAQTAPTAAPISVNFNGDQYSYDPKDLLREARDKLGQLLAAMPRT